MWILLILLAAVGVVLFLKNKDNDKTNHNKTPEKTVSEWSYEKKCLMTEMEKKFYNAIKKSVGDEYTVLPQINLATVVNKTGDFKYQNELYRNIDFGVFDKDFNVVLLIEINDETHNDAKRKQRDAKVRDITSCADIPLISFWTKYGVNQDYITKQIKENIK